MTRVSFVTVATILLGGLIFSIVFGQFQRDAACEWVGVSDYSPNPLLVSDVAISANWQYAVTGFWDGTGFLWDISTGMPIRALYTNGRQVRPVAIAPNGKSIFIGASDGIGIVWDTSTGQPVHKLLGEGGTVESAAFSQDSRWIVTGHEDFTAVVWNAASGDRVKVLKDELSADEGGVLYVAFTPNACRVLTASDGGAITLWDVSLGATVKRIVSAGCG